MGQKALFFDVDGTLIDLETREAPRSAVTAIREVLEAGNMVLINSGREICLLRGIMEAFGIDSVICGCGTHIIINGKTVFRHHIGHERGIQIKKSILKFGLDSFLECQEETVFSPPPFKDRRDMEDQMEYQSTLTQIRENAFDEDDYDFDKFAIFTDPHFPDKESVNGFIRSVPDIDCMDHGRGYYECIQRGFDKGTAIRFVLDYYHIPFEDAYVFGDSVNDLAMFRSAAKNRVLMGEHDTALEEYSTFTTKNVMEDGIAFAIRTLGII